MRERLNCPNCGAPITSEKCEYCGTLFYDFANIERDKPCYIRMRLGDITENGLLVFKAIPTDITIEHSCETVGVGFEYGNKPLYAMPKMTVKLELEVVTDDENLFRFYKKF